MSKPEDKPSFFDPSEEANTWPPSDSYETDDENEIQETSSAGGFDVDSILSDMSGYEGRKEDPETEELAEDFLVPIKKDKPEEDPILNENTFVNDVIEEELITTEEPAIVEETTTAVEENIQELEDESVVESMEAPMEPVLEVISESEPKTNSGNFNVDDLFDEPSSSSQTSGSSSNYTEFKASPYSIEEEQELKPFRTYFSFDYSETEIPVAEDAGSPLSNILQKVNRNVLILAVVVIGFGIYFLVSTINSRNYDKFNKTARERAPRKAKKVVQEFRAGQRVPIWEISSQKTISSGRDAQIARAIFESSGRENPFAIPDSILADYRKAAEIAAVKQQEPNTYKRKAYRASLVGVLTSQDSTVALIDIQEAAFDVVEGTGKTKILQLATKAMDKAKKNTQEMVVGSYVGPWAVVKIDSAKNTFSEAKVTIEYNGQRKVLNMGKAEELGIFDEEGVLDNLENPVEKVNLDDFNW